MSILEQIQSNTITNLHLSTDPDEEFDRVSSFIDAIGSNTSIETVKFDEDFVGCFRHDDRSDLLKALSKIPSLKEVHLADACLLVKDITEILVQAKGLVSFSLKDVVLQGDDKTLKACELAIHQHPCLKKFDLTDCTTAIKDLSVDGLQVASSKSCTGIAGGPQALNATGAKTA
eukprot:CAMPEP_0178866316 /NCGR_PEP_ID=MMETSP0747-20121128/4882_1 /TAXON_ID=913974 /ORGANISM="Nitzschia punctata, Strain CCMP561" /LENGTH=173 /DNA_ID=CAMNT_0020533169 /DNA_START=10 /DNA_END=531 /DNA_ORIENTATION=+